MSKTNIRSVTTADIPSLIKVIDSTGLFPGELLPEMIGTGLDASDSQEYWLTYVTDKPVAVAYFAPERMTKGTWNLYLIAVHANHQGQGIGKQIMTHVEDFLRNRGERVLLVETSGLDELASTRQFYTDIGYHNEASIRDFYDAGDDKIVFWKKLS